MAEAEEERKLSIDPATNEMIAKARADGANIAFDRAEKMKPCPIGQEGSCCRKCSMGPCRVPMGKNKEETPEEKARRKGVCGATAETIAARNFTRMIAAGSAAHSDHARKVAEVSCWRPRAKPPVSASRTSRSCSRWRSISGSRSASAATRPSPPTSASWPCRNSGSRTESCG